MKTLSLALIGAALVLASCSSSKNTASAEYDDVYYNPNTAAQQETQYAAVGNTTVSPQEVMETQALNQNTVYAEPMVPEENLSDYEQYRLQREAEMLGETYTPEGSEALYVDQYQEFDTLSQYGEASAPVIVNNYNYYTDPNEYYYSSNLRRFSDDYAGWNYYDPYYTNYGYGGSRFSWGLSMGFGMGYGMGMSFGWGYPSYGYGGYYPYYGYGGYYDPYWGYGGYGYRYPYYGGSYWSGYNHGYYNGYWNGYYGGGGYYPETYYRYGRMDSRQYAGYSRPSKTTVGSAKGVASADPRYRSRTSSASTKTAAVRSGNSSAAQRSSGNVRTTRTIPANGQKTNRAVMNSNRSSNSSNMNATRVRNGNGQQNRTSTYTPNYSKPRTSSSSANRSAVQSRTTTQSRTYTQPSSTPQRAGTYNPSSNRQQRSSTSYSRQSSPSRSSSSYTRPSSTRSSSSYSRPSSTRSSSSYSRPSSSTRSYSSGSSPSRSSGSSYSRSSSPSRSSGSSVGRSSSGGSRSMSSGSRSSSGGSRSSGSSRR